MYSGGASKDPNLSIGGGPGKYDTAKAINAAKTILKQNYFKVNNLLSIDFGERYMGFAIRTVKTQIPIPIEVVDIKKDNISNKISTYVDSYDINEFIIGYPLGMNLSENRMTNNVDNFIERRIKKI